MYYYRKYPTQKIVRLHFGEVVEIFERMQIWGIKNGQRIAGKQFSEFATMPVCIFRSNLKSWLFEAQTVVLFENGDDKADDSQ